jgi:peptidoglycan/LPS O-acetylase OafA/YrhL
MNTKPIYLPGLNGLRAIAALSVVIGHVTSYSYSTFNLPKVNIGFDGVTLFFVISGFLITYLLLQEAKATNTVDVKSFYMRRILRIWPIYYLIILISLLVALYNKNIDDIFSTNILFYLFFAANIPLIIQQGIIIIVHYWSIGVEEQFYLIWPWVVKLVSNKLIPVTIGIIVFLFLIKSGVWYFIGNQSILYKSLAVTRFHCMLIGAVGAMLYYNQNKNFIKIVANRFVQYVAWLFTLVLFFDVIYFPAPLISEITALISLVLIIGQINQNTRKVINLENNYFDFLGKISYGIYVIHPLVILLFYYLFTNLDVNNILKTIIVYTSVVFTTIILSYLSYEYYEKPFLIFKKRFTVVKSANSKFKKE